MTPSLKAWRACEEHFQREFREKLAAHLHAMRGPILSTLQHDVIEKEIRGFHLSWSDAKALEVIASFSEDVPD